jgi:hypothetical protein
VLELIGESQHRLAGLVEEHLEEIEEEGALLAHGAHRRHEARVHEVEACRAEEIVVCRELADERGKNAAAAAIEPVEQTLK